MTRFVTRCPSLFQTKALFTELVLPLEQKLEKDFKKPAVSATSFLTSPDRPVCVSSTNFMRKVSSSVHSRCIFSFVGVSLSGELNCCVVIVSCVNIFSLSPTKSSDGMVGRSQMLRIGVCAESLHCLPPWVKVMLHTKWRKIDTMSTDKKKTSEITSQRI